MDVGGRAKHDSREGGGRTKQDARVEDARAEQSAIRHEQHRHPGKLEGKSMLEGVVPPFPTYIYGLRGFSLSCAELVMPKRLILIKRIRDTHLLYLSS